MNHEVTGCRDCILCHEEAAEYYCTHPLGINESGENGLEVNRTADPDSDDYYEPITPVGCPLNKESITITKK
jgi:hypothetical protein